MDGIESFRESVEHAVIGQIAQNLFIQSSRCRVSPREVLEASFGHLQAGVGESGEHTCHILPALLLRNPLARDPGRNVAHKGEVCSHGRRGGVEGVEMVFFLDLEYLTQQGKQLGGRPPGGYNAIGLRLWATDGSGIALQIFPAGATRLITIWSDEKRSPDRTSSATCGRTARTTVSDPSSTSWLEAHTETFSNRLASPAATPALRGDKRMVRRAPPSELRPLTMAAAMAPVPMNPRIIEIYFIVPDGSGRRRKLAGLRTADWRCGRLLTPSRNAASSGR